MTRPASDSNKFVALIVGVLVVVIALLAGRSWLRDQESGSESSKRERHTTTDPGQRRRGADGPAVERTRGDASETSNEPPLDEVENLAHAPLPAHASPDPSRCGALEGRVINWSTRRGVPAAELSFMREGIAHTTQTGADGQFRFEAPSEGAWALATVTAEGFLPYAPEPGREGVVFVARPGQRVERADLFLFPAVDYEGRVVDAEGEPIARAQVELFGADSGERALVGIVGSFTTDAEGRFGFHAPDGALLEAQHPDHPPGRARVDGSVQVSHRMTIVMGSAPAANEGGGAIQGRLVDADEVGLADVEILAYPVDERGQLGDRGLLRDQRTTTSADGSFTLTPLDSSAYWVTARLVGRPAPKAGPVEPGAEVELRLEPGLRLSGTLRNDEGAAVPAGNVALLRIDGPIARSPVASLAVFDPIGQFQFDDLEPGPYELLAIAQGHARSEPVEVTLEREGPSPEVALILGRGASIVGEVRDAETDEPLALAMLSVTGVDGADSILPGLRTTVSAEDGSFELVGVDPGRVSLTAQAFAHDGKVVSGIELEAGERHGPLRIELAPVGEGEQPKTEITGIGVAIGPSEGAIAVTQVIEGGGAEAAGIEAGEAILAVDGQAVAELGFEAAVENIRGPVGTTVVLELRRLDGSTAELVVERRVIVAPG